MQKTLQDGQKAPTTFGTALHGYSLHKQTSLKVRRRGYRLFKIKAACKIVANLYAPCFIRLGGSYLRNEQIDPWSDKKLKQQHYKRKGTYLSDIDLSIDTGINEIIKKYNIQLRYALPNSIEIWNKEKGFIMWDFTKLDQEGIDAAIVAYEVGDTKELMKLHNQYQLSNEVYTCGCQENIVYKWFKYGFDNNLISTEDATTD